MNVDCSSERAGGFVAAATLTGRRPSGGHLQCAQQCYCCNQQRTWERTGTAVMGPHHSPLQFIARSS